MFFFFSSRRRHTRCALVTGVQTCALPICLPLDRALRVLQPDPRRRHADAQRLPHRVLLAGGHPRVARDLRPDLAVHAGDADQHQGPDPGQQAPPHVRSEEHTSELQSLMRSSYAVFCLKKKKTKTTTEIRYVQDKTTNK